LPSFVLPVETSLIFSRTAAIQLASNFLMFIFFKRSLDADFIDDPHGIAGQTKLDVALFGGNPIAMRV